MQCLGIAEQMGLVAEQRIVRPRRPWSWWAPFGPPDPRDGPSSSTGALRPPFPDIVIASGRRAVPGLRAVKRASGGQTFTVFLKMPTCGRHAADAIWVPEHDPMRGDNVIVTVTSPSRISPAALAAARDRPDARLARLPEPRVAMMLGGPGAGFCFDDATVARIVEVARSVLTSGASLMVTSSRRTPQRLLEALLALSHDKASATRLFVWRGEPPNPYIDMLALARSVIVTADSVNMMGEAAVTGVPIHVVEPPGGHRRVRRFIDSLVAHGAVRRWTGSLERFSYVPLDATPAIARELADRYVAFRRAAPLPVQGRPP